MKKSVFLIAFLLVGFFGMAQNERPYVIKYKTLTDTIYHHTQSISGIHIDASGQELIHEDGTDWSSLTDLDTVYVYRSDLVNPNYVPIDWDDATLVASADSIGNYQIHFEGEIPEVVPGSIITIDQDTVVHYVLVESVDVNGNIMNISSVEAYLTDIFADTDFTLTTDLGGKSPHTGKVFYPVAAYQKDDNGTYVALDLEAMRATTWGFTHDLWQYGANFDGENIVSGNHYTVYMERMNFNFDLDLELYMNFSGRDVHEIVGDAIDRWRSRALNVNAFLRGSFDAEERLRCDVDGGFNYNLGYDLWKHNIFRPLPIRFVVYGVPVVITLSSDLYRHVQLTGSGEISAYTGFADNAEGRLGFAWKQGHEMEPASEFTNGLEFTPPTLEGYGSLQGKVWAFPRVKLLLYDALGPSFDFKPYLSVTLSGGFKEEMLGQGNDFCAWSLDCNTGLDLACGLSLQFMGYEVQNYSTPDWNFIDRMLYHSPQRIQKVSLEGSGQTKTATFNVYDRNHLFNMDVITPLPQFVKFEAEGELSSEYGIAHSGQVTVNWTPSENDILYAKLYNTNGAVMAWDTIHAPTELPSVTTYEVTNITTDYAMATGEVTDEGGGTVTERGICWSTEHNPTTDESHVASGSGMGLFTVSMTGLTENTTYYVRAYAINEVGAAYGNEETFTTLTRPTVTTAQVTNITQTTATGGGEVVSDNGSPVTERGICWSSAHDPSISDSHATSGEGTGTFTVNMTGLTPNTTYYVRAYAINSVGPAYGNPVSFMTTDLPTVTTAQVTNITQTTATSGGTVTCNNGCEITERGICWGTNHNPTTIGNHVTNGTGTGTFTCTMTGLTGGTTYYARAYAISDTEIVYGNEVQFETELIVVVTLPVTNITSITAIGIGVVEGNGSRERGLCWGTNHNPDLNDNYVKCDRYNSTFSHVMKTLMPNMTYYVRAYTINNANEVIYGNEESFYTDVHFVQVGDGDSIKTSYFPFNTLWNHSIATAIFRASELESSGMTTSPITSVNWYATNENGYSQQGITIWMANVSENVVSSLSPLASGMTKVFTGDITPAIGWNEFVFNEGSFAWDGHSNILILCQRNGDWHGSVLWLSSSTDYQSVSYQFSDADIQPQPGHDFPYGYYVNLFQYNMDTGSVRPNIIFRIPNP